MESSTAKELIGLMSERASSWQALWTVFYTVSAALVTLIASGKFLPQHRLAASLISIIGYMLFAAGNFLALDGMRKQRKAVIEFVKDKAIESPYILAVADASAPPSQNRLRFYHWGLCIFVIVLLAVIPKFQAPP